MCNVESALEVRGEEAERENSKESMSRMRMNKDSLYS
jgi:hypothetical protein